MLDELSLRTARRGVGVQRICKRVIDLVGSAVMLAVLSPVMLAIALIVRVTSRGPAIFRQERLGLNGRPFPIYKFRSMYVDAEKRLHADPELHRLYRENGYKIPAERDPRITPIGRFLRASSLDELPQLFNVLAGDMSLVGPRPIVPPEIENYGLSRMAFLSVKPGVTGYWQINGRSDVDYPKRVGLDLYYIQNWSLGLDVRILIKTVPALLARRGAY